MEERKIEDIEKEYKEWAMDLLKSRLNLKPEAFDLYQQGNYTYDSVVDCLWEFVKPGYEQLLWYQFTRDKEIKDRYESHISYLRRKCEMLEKQTELMYDRLVILECGKVDYGE